MTDRRNHPASNTVQAAVPVAPDAAQIAAFADMAFSWCEGVIPLRGIPEQGQPHQSPQNHWCPADHDAATAMVKFVQRAFQSGVAAYVIPGTVASLGQASASHVLQMQAVVADLDSGDIAAIKAHLCKYLGVPTMVVESGGRTNEGQAKLHLWWKLTEPASGNDLVQLCLVRGEIAVKVGGDRHFASAHQPIRVPGSVYRKNGALRLTQICAHNPNEYDLAEFAAAVAAMPSMAGIAPAADIFREKPSIDAVLTTPVREGGQDQWSRFEGASAAIGFYLRQAHEGRLTKDEAWQAICGYNAAMLRPPWPLDRLKTEAASLWNLHIQKYGPAKPEPVKEDKPPAQLKAFTLGALLDDASPMPQDLIGPRVLTPGGLMVLGGAPKVGKSDFLISLLVHMAAGQPFLGFTPHRPLRIFYLQAEIQYDYLRERLRQVTLPPATIALARETFVATPKLNILLDTNGLAATIATIKSSFPNAAPDIICVDPLRNVFDGGSQETTGTTGSENDNASMMHFLRGRIDVLREAVNPNAGIILAHHTRKVTKDQLKNDPFQVLSGASALRSYYTTGLLLHRPNETESSRRLEIELRNGPAMPTKVIDKVGGSWIETNPNHERLTRIEIGAKQDAERDRKRDVIVTLLHTEAAEGRLYTTSQFSERFENQADLGSSHTIQNRIGVLATKGHIKFLRDPTAFGIRKVTTRMGFMVVEDMRFRPQEIIDPDTGEISTKSLAVLPSHYKCPQSGALLEVENPEVWVPHKSDNDGCPTYRSDKGETL